MAFPIRIENPVGHPGPPLDATDVAVIGGGVTTPSDLRAEPGWRCRRFSDGSPMRPGPAL